MLQQVSTSTTSHGTPQQHQYYGVPTPSPFPIRLNLTHLQFFSEVVSLFGCAIINNPEGLLDAEFTKKGRIEHHFCSMNSVSIVFIEVKKTYVFGKGRLDVIAQVLAECAGMSNFSLFLVADFDDAVNNISLRLSELET